MTYIFTARCYVKRSIAVERRLSVRLSVTLLYSLYCGRMCWVVISKVSLIKRMISLGSSHLGDPTSLIYYKENGLKFV